MFKIEEVMKCIISTLKSCSDPYLIVHQQALKCFGILIMKMQLLLPSKSDSCQIPEHICCFLLEFQEKYSSRVLDICEGYIKNNCNIESVSNESLRKFQQFKSITSSLCRSLAFTSESCLV